jgi:hypothetical protein
LNADLKRNLTEVNLTIQTALLSTSFGTYLQKNLVWCFRPRADKSFLRVDGINKLVHEVIHPSEFRTTWTITANLSLFEEKYRHQQHSCGTKTFSSSWQFAGARGGGLGCGSTYGRCLEVET